MGEVVNLRSARKRADRAGREKEAAANRRKHGRTKVEKAADRAETRRTDGVVDGARLSEPPAMDDV